MTIYYHKHHIIPRHAGGTDEPSNIITLTVEDHAEAHRKLHEEHGRWQDYLAWKGLSHQIKTQDVLRLKISLSSQQHNREKVKNGTHHLLGGRHAKEKVKNGTHHLLGGKHVKQLVEDGLHNFLGGEIQRKTNKRRVDEGSHNLLGPHSNISRLKNGTHPSQLKKTCEHCKKTISIGMFARWHGDNCKSLNHL